MRLAAWCVLVLATIGCEASHQRGDDGGRAASDAHAVTCLPAGTYGVSIVVTASDCGMPDGPVRLDVPLPPPASGWPTDACHATVADLGDCTWRIDSDCPIPDASTSIHGTITGTTEGITGHFTSMSSDISGRTCTAVSDWTRAD